MKLKLLLVQLFLTTLSLHSQTVIQAGEVSGEWTADGSPYIIEGNIIVNKDLIIEPGVDILFNDDTKMTIYGKLIAEGSKTDSISFKSNNLNWSGIQFYNSSQESILKYFQISGVRNLVTAYGGAINVTNSNNTKISDGKIFNNSSDYRGGGISLIDLNNFNLKNLLIFNNSLYLEGYSTVKEGTAIYVMQSSVNLINCTITKNSYDDAAYGVATVYWAHFSEVTITNCIIYGNKSYAIGSNNYDMFDISNSIIENIDNFGGNSNINGKNNYDVIPNFIDANNNNFNIKWTDYPNQLTKPLEVDGGISTIHDEDGSVSDIGACIFDQTGKYFEPFAWFSSDENRIQSGTSVQFINKSLNGSENIVNYLWNFGDGSISNEEHPIHTFSNNGKFDVSLKVTDTKGNSNTSFINDYIISGTLINTPEVFGNWNSNYSPYIINNDIVILESNLLQVNPGVEILFNGHYRLTVNGDLVLNGSSEERILVTALDTLNFWNLSVHSNFKTNDDEHNGWNGLVFKGNNRNSILKYTDFSFRKNYGFDGGLPSEDFGGTVLITDNFENNLDPNPETSNFTIENCRFINNNGYAINYFSDTYRGAGINALRSNITVKNCVFENNTAYSALAIYLFTTSNSKIINNTIKNNNPIPFNDYNIKIRASSDFSIKEGDQILIESNTIENNSHGGIYIGIDGDILIENNFINNNRNSGIETLLSNPKINRNYITNNSASEGAGIKIGPTSRISIVTNNYISGNINNYYWAPGGSGILCKSNTYIVNNTFTNNSSLGVLGQAIFADNSTCTAINNILFQNPKGNFGQNRGGGLYKPLTLLNNFESNPLFNDEKIPQILKISPCIDSGTIDLPFSMTEKDLLGNPRINNKIDIGAVEFNNTLHINDTYDDIKNIYIYPNPSKEFFSIHSNFSNFENTDISIYTLDGKKIINLKNYNFNSDNKKIDINKLNPGLYYIIISNNSIFFKEMLIVQ